MTMYQEPVDLANALSNIDIKSNYIKDENHDYIIDAINDHAETYIKPIFNLLGYDCHIVNYPSEIPLIGRDFDNALHVRNCVWLSKGKTAVHLYDLWHEVGHAIVADATEAMGINWIGMHYYQGQQVFESDIIETYATIASECVMEIFGIPDDFINGLSKYTNGIYGKNYNGKHLSYKDPVHENCGLVKRINMLKKAYDLEYHKEISLDNYKEFRCDDSVKDTIDLKLKNDNFYFGSFPPNWRRGKDFLSDEIIQINATSYSNKKKKIEYSREDFTPEKIKKSILKPNWMLG
jgi:hypothetical protein